jgi:hypothetical protein
VNSLVTSRGGDDTPPNDVAEQSSEGELLKWLDSINLWRVGTCLTELGVDSIEDLLDGSLVSDADLIQAGLDHLEIATLRRALDAFARRTELPGDKNCMRKIARSRQRASLKTMVVGHLEASIYLFSVVGNFHRAQRLVISGFVLLIAGCIATLAYLKVGVLPPQGESWYVDWSKDRFSSSDDALSVIDPSVSFGAWEGWGTSLCWWANVAGKREDYLDLFFTLKPANKVLYHFDTYWNSDSSSGSSQSELTLPGLGLTVVRYNAGGHGWRNVSQKQHPKVAEENSDFSDGGREESSSSFPHLTTNMVNSPNEPPFKMIEGFWLDPRSEDPESSSWDWGVDQNQVKNGIREEEST